MNESEPRVLVLVLAWNGRELTEACIDSILKLDYPRFDVLVERSRSLRIVDGICADAGRSSCP